MSTVRGPYRRRRKVEQTIEALTVKELRVLMCLADGMSNGEIGEDMFISEHTVKEHVSSVLYKLRAKNRAHAVGQAYHLGVLRPKLVG